MFLSRITITCFAASYLVVLVLEISRLFFQTRIRRMVMLAFVAAGLFAHAAHLWMLADTAETGAPLSTWKAWCLMASFIVALAYAGLLVRRPENAFGIFLLPLVLGLIGVGWMLRDAAAFSADRAWAIWRFAHGVSLLLGTVAVLLGFAAGVMYLLQSWRLKRKLPPSRVLKLPSLEWLQRFNRESLLVSTALLAIGLVTGLVLARKTSAGLWTDPTVISSGILFFWLLTSSTFEYFYRPAREGRKVAYMTLASFIFLGLALGSVLWGHHASGGGAAKDGDGASGQSAAPWTVIADFGGGRFGGAWSGTRVGDGGERR